MTTLLISEINNCKCNLKLTGPYWNSDGCQDPVACPYLERLIGGTELCKASGKTADRDENFKLYQQCPLPKVQPNEDTTDS